MNNDTNSDIQNSVDKFIRAKDIWYDSAVAAEKALKEQGLPEFPQMSMIISNEGDLQVASNVKGEHQLEFAKHVILVLANKFDKDLFHDLIDIMGSVGTLEA